MTTTTEKLAMQLSRAIDHRARALEIDADVIAVEQDNGAGGTTTTWRVLDVDGQAINNLVWVRFYGGDENDLVQAYNVSGTKPFDKQPVVLREIRPGRYEVLRQRAEEADRLLGANAPYYSGSPDNGEAYPNLVPGRSLIPGRVELVSTDTPLVVEVRPFWFRYFGQYQRWPGGTVDLSDYLPATANYWAWALIGIWPYDNSIRVVMSAEYAGGWQLTDETLSELSSAIEGLVPCDAVMLQEGLTALRDEYLWYGRLNAAEVGFPAHPIAMSSAYHHLPANRRAVWYGPITLTGDYVIEGELTIL